MRRIIWYLKQLLPLRYESKYVQGGERKRAVWRMWIGHCFCIQHSTILR